MKKLALLLVASACSLLFAAAPVPQLVQVWQGWDGGQRINVNCSNCTGGGGGTASAVSIDGGYVSVTNTSATVAPLACRLTDGTSFYTASGGGGGGGQASIALDGGSAGATQVGTWTVGVSNFPTSAPLPLQNLATGNLIAAGTSVVFSQAYAAPSIGVSVTGTWVGTIVFEASINGADYFQMETYNPSVTAETTQSSTTVNGVFQVMNVAGMQYVRARMSVWTSGSAFVIITGTQQVDNVMKAAIKETGVAAPSYGVMVAGSDGTNIRHLKTDSTGVLATSVSTHAVTQSSGLDGGVWATSAQLFAQNASGYWGPLESDPSNVDAVAAQASGLLDTDAHLRLLNADGTFDRWRGTIDGGAFVEVRAHPPVVQGASRDGGFDWNTETKLVDGVNNGFRATVKTSGVAASASDTALVVAQTTVGGNPCRNPSATLAMVSGSTTGTASVQLVALSGTTKIYVCSMVIIGTSGTTPTFSLTYGTGAACATGNVVIIGAFTTTANALFNFSNPFAVTAAGNALCYVQTGTTPISRYAITYVQQ